MVNVRTRRWPDYCNLPLAGSYTIKVRVTWLLKCKKFLQNLLPDSTMVTVRDLYDSETPIYKYEQSVYFHEELTTLIKKSPAVSLPL